MSNKDFVLPFLLSNKLAGGRVISLEDSITSILNKHNYPETIGVLLGELLTVVSMLGQSLKSTAIITCQLQPSANSLISLLVAEYVFGGEIRGFADFDKEKILEKPNLNFQDLVGKDGVLIVTLDNGQERYQGVIELNEQSLTSSFAKYLKQSEQIDSLVKISVFRTVILDEVFWKSGGILIQKLPEIDAQINSDEWNKINIFFDTITNNELVNLSPENLLVNLFHKEGVIIYEKQKIIYKCRCERKKMEQVLKTFSKEEYEKLKINNKIIIKCHFCNNEEIFE